MATAFSNVISIEEIESILNLQNVIDARTQLANGKTKIDFTIHLSESIKQKLLDVLGLNLFSVSEIPMRWICGNTHAHADSDASHDHFDNTYLMYLTDSVGTLNIGNQSYAMTKGSAYVFEKGIMHGTTNTDDEPRLLLGPMSNMGAQVGGFTGISSNGSSNVYIREIEGTIEYSVDNKESWYNIGWPCSITNNNRADYGMMYVFFDTDITLTDANQYFVCASEFITFGSETLNEDWIRPVITIDGVTNYPGLVQNGTNSDNGYFRVNIFNLEITTQNSSTLAEFGGWFGQRFFAKGAIGTPCSIVNCRTDAPISQTSGGIVGAYAGSFNGYIVFFNCQSTGTIGQSAGGICGPYACYSSGRIVFYYCFSSGAIGNFSGGICGPHVAAYSGYLVIVSCYSGGQISANAGGILGINTGTDDSGLLGSCFVYYSYSTGAIGENAGGIVAPTPYDRGYIRVENCFTTGTISNVGYAGGIYGGYYFDTSRESAHYCYTSGLKLGAPTGIGGIYGNISSDVIAGSSNNYSEENNSRSGWSDENAKSVLQDTPNSSLYGDTWCQPNGINTPFKLSHSQLSPFTLSTNSENYVVTTAVAGQSTSLTPYASGFTYKLLRINTDSPTLYPGITINPTTGAITFASSNVDNYYYIYVFSEKDDFEYSTTLINVTVAKTIEVINVVKKFVGGNRDSSAVIRNKSRLTVESMRTDQLRNKSDAVNIQNRRQALNRVRSGGYIVPKKVTQRYLL